MHYIVFDLEFNQDFTTLKNDIRNRSQYLFEIIQIGAVKLDVNFNTVATFNRYVKPTIYSKISSFITELTGITTEQLIIEEQFHGVYNAFIQFIDDSDTIFCIWGMADIKVLFRNVEYHKLDSNLLSKFYINLQPSVSKLLNLPPKKLARLQNAVEAFNIPITYEFHNAFYDAYYTAEIFKKISNSYINPKFYDPSYVKTRPRLQKKVIDIDKLIQQFEKMYNRAMTQEEKDIIKLAYQMGKTHQFLK